MSNDAICPNCGADNLDDYPVCAACALTCHFPSRETCRLCAAAALVPEIAAFLRSLVIAYDQYNLNPRVLPYPLLGLSVSARRMLAQIHGGGK